MREAFLGMAWVGPGMRRFRRALVHVAGVVAGMVVIGLPLALPELASAQTILHSQLVDTPGGASIGLFEVAGGVATPIATGLPTNNFASLSPDGRFVTISSGDPAFPNEASDDLWEYDRATGLTRKIIDNETETQPDGSIFFSSPVFTGRSPDNQLVAVATQLGAVPGGGLPQQLTVHRASDGFNVGLAQIGQGGALDLTRGEYLGISWLPDGSAFATPAYVGVLSNTGRQTAAIGIVTFAFDPSTLNYAPVGTLTTPQVFDLPGTIVQENHAFPVISPNGQQLAFFSITFPDPFLAGPVTTRLHTIGTNGANSTTLVTFTPGLFPLGVSWSSDGSQLAFSIADQVENGGFFSPLGAPETAILRTVPAAGGTPSPVAGAPLGFLPSIVPAPEPTFVGTLAAGLVALAALAQRATRRTGRSKTTRV